MAGINEAQIEAAPAELRLGSGAVVGATPLAVSAYEYGGDVFKTIEEKRRRHLYRILEIHGVPGITRLVDILIHDLEALTAHTPPIQAWKTTDGVLYRNHAEADRHQAQLNHERNLIENTRRYFAA